MSEKFLRFEAVTLDELMKRMRLDGLGWHRGIVAASLMRNDLRPYIFRGWEDEQARFCKAEIITDALLNNVNCEWVGHNGGKHIPMRHGGNYAREEFSFSGLVFDSASIIFKRQDIDSFLAPTTPDAIIAELDLIRDELGEAMLLVDRLEAENAKLRKNSNGGAAKRDEGRDKSTATRWEGYMTTAVKVAFEIALAPQREYTNRELGKLAATFGGEWIGKNDRPRTPLEVFKDAMPTSYRKGSGAPKQYED